MSNRRHIHKAVKEQLVSMAARMKSRTIAHVTGVSQRTVNRVIRLKRLTGLFIRVPFAAGRPRLLNGIDASMSILELAWGFLSNKIISISRVSSKEHQI